MSITSLRVTYETPWLENWVKENGDSVQMHPNTFLLQGTITHMKNWYEYKGINWEERLIALLKLLWSIHREGQKEPIKVYKDLRINTGHKRASIMYLLGYEKIKAIIVPDDTKL